MFNFLKSRNIKEITIQNINFFVLTSFLISFSIIQILTLNNNELFAVENKTSSIQQNTKKSKDSKNMNTNIKIGIVDITKINADEFITNTITKIQEYYEIQYKELEIKSNGLDLDVESKAKKLESTKEQNIISNEKYNEEKTKIQNDYSTKKQKIAMEAELLHQKLMSSIEMMYDVIKQTSELVAKNKNLILVTEKHYIYYQSTDLQEISITEEVLLALKNNKKILELKNDTKVFFEKANKK